MTHLTLFFPTFDAILSKKSGHTAPKKEEAEAEEIRRKRKTEEPLVLTSRCDLI